MPSHFSSADTVINKNFSESSSFFTESNRPRYIHQNWTTITHRPKTSICTGPNISHFYAKTTAQRALHSLYEDCLWPAVIGTESSTPTPPPAHSSLAI